MRTLGGTGSGSVETATDRTFQNVTSAILGKRILLVDDSTENLRLMQFFLAEAGCTTDIATTCSAALALHKSGRGYDAALVDIQMPGADGYDTARALRDQNYRGLIIAITAEQALDARKANPSQFAGVIHKPITATHLVAELSYLLASQSFDTERQTIGRGCSLATLDIDRHIFVAASPAIRDTILRFLLNLPSKLDVIRSAYEQSDFHHFQRSVHKMMGIAGTIGLNSIVSQLNRLECCVTRNDLTKAILEKSIKEIEKLATQITKLFEDQRNDD